MTKDVLFYSIFSIEMKYIFNLTRRICRWNRAQTSSKIIQQMIIIKHHNIAINKKERENEEHFDAWDIFRKTENENFGDLSLIDSFNKSLNNVLIKIF